MFNGHNTISPYAMGVNPRSLFSPASERFNVLQIQHNVPPRSMFDQSTNEKMLSVENTMADLKCSSNKRPSSQLYQQISKKRKIFKKVLDIESSIDDILVTAPSIASILIANLRKLVNEHSVLREALSGGPDSSPSSYSTASLHCVPSKSFFNDTLNAQKNISNHQTIVQLSNSPELIVNLNANKTWDYTSDFELGITDLKSYMGSSKDEISKLASDFSACIYEDHREVKRQTILEKLLTTIKLINNNSRADSHDSYMANFKKFIASSDVLRDIAFTYVENAPSSSDLSNSIDTLPFDTSYSNIENFRTLSAPTSPDMSCLPSPLPLNDTIDAFFRMILVAHSPGQKSSGNASLMLLSNVSSMLLSNMSSTQSLVQPNDVLPRQVLIYSLPGSVLPNTSVSMLAQVSSSTTSTSVSVPILNVPIIQKLWLELTEYSLQISKRNYIDGLYPRNTSIKVAKKGGLEDEQIVANKVGLDITRRYFIISKAPSHINYRRFWISFLLNSSVLIDLTTEEDGLQNCYPEKGQKKSIDHINVELIEKDHELHTYEVGNVIWREGIKSRSIVKVNHFAKWLDGDVISVNELSKLVDRVRSLFSDTQKPIWIYSKAGMGRSGTLVTACILKEKIANSQLERKQLGGFLVDLVLSLRQQRGCQLVQNEKQLGLLYEYACFILPTSRFTPV